MKRQNLIALIVPFPLVQLPDSAVQRLFDRPGSSLGDRFQSEQSLEGSVDEVLVFDRQLSASEVAEIYSATICD